MQAVLQHVMAGFDCLFLPAMLTAAQPLGYETGPMGDVDLSLARPFNLTGSPALSFCTGRTPEGLPVGGQLVGHRQQDASLLTVAGVIERHI